MRYKVVQHFPHAVGGPLFCDTEKEWQLEDNHPALYMPEYLLDMERKGWIFISSYFDNYSSSEIIYFRSNNIEEEL